MGTPRIDRAKALAEALTNGLTDLGVLATIDPVAAAHAAGRGAAILIVPPRLRWTGPDVTGFGPVATWQLFLVCALTDDAAAWERLDAVLDPLADLIDIENADPTGMENPTGGVVLPAYTVTFTETV